MGFGVMRPKGTARPRASDSKIHIHQPPWYMSCIDILKPTQHLCGFGEIILIFSLFLYQFN